METKTFKVPGISCMHCVHTIKTEVGEIAGVQSVEADKDTKMVTVNWGNPADWEKIRATLVEINYPPEGLITLM
ncbi:MAG: heavy-metal-associated domain-containing protein [Candidatus Promineofilum sp.]|nr:heavy-metal-associated domain-containing protein [Promineifilum sp.]